MFYYMDNFIQSGFRKGCNTQYRLLKMLEKWNSVIDKGKFLGALLTDSHKAFDYLPHDLLLAKWLAYGFNLSSLKTQLFGKQKTKNYNRFNI